MEKVTARPVPNPNESHSEIHPDHPTDEQAHAPPARQTADRDALEREHTELERQLAALDRHLSLTPDEQIEQRRLKKQKLRVKDQLYRLGLLATRGA